MSPFVMHHIPECMKEIADIWQYILQSYIYSISELSIGKITWQIAAAMQGLLIYRRPLFLCWEDVFFILECILWLVQKYSPEVKEKREKIKIKYF